MQTFTTPAPISAVLDIPAGRIELTAHDQDSATVEIRPADSSKSRDVKLAEQTIAEYRDGVLRITSHAGNRLLGSSGSVEVTVRLPAGSSVEAKAASAHFITSGPLGDVTFDSSQATVKVDQAVTAHLTTVDGDITAGRLSGDSELRTVRGEIKVTEAMKGTLVLRSETGAITVGTPAGVSAVLDAGTTMGRIHNALTNTGGAPDLTIHATTTLGDITATSR